MTAQITRTSAAHGDFTTITLQPNDDVVIHFTGNAERKSASPNQERGVHVRVDAHASVGVNGSHGLGDSLAIDDEDRVAAWATSTAFWVNGSLDPWNSIGSRHQYLRHIPSDDVRRVSAFDASAGKVTLSEAFRRIITPLSVSTSANQLLLAQADVDLISTGDAITVDAAGGVGGLTAGTTYYAIKVTTGSVGIKLATSAANASAGTAISLTSEGTAADVRIDLPLTVEDTQALRLHGEDPAHSFTIRAASTAKQIRLSAGADRVVGQHWDLEVRIGSVDEVRRVESVDTVYHAQGRTFTGLAYNSGSRAFTAASAGDYRGIEGVGVLVVLNNGGYTNLNVGDAFDVEDPQGASRTFKLQDGGADITLTSGSISASAVSVANDTITVASADAAKLANLATGTRMVTANNGGFGGIGNDGSAHYLIKTDTATVFKLATSKANAEAGTAVSITGTGTATNVRFTTGTVGDMVLSQAEHSFGYTLTEPFSAAPAEGAAVHVVAGESLGQVTARVETATAATTTIIPLVDYNAKLSNDHDLLIGGQLRDIASVDATAKTVTLTTALSAAPVPGELVGFGHTTSEFISNAAITVASGGTAKEVTLDYPVSGLRFTGTGSTTNRAKVRLSGAWIPAPLERT